MSVEIRSRWSESKRVELEVLCEGPGHSSDELPTLSSPIVDSSGRKTRVSVSEGRSTARLNPEDLLTQVRNTLQDHREVQDLVTCGVVCPQRGGRQCHISGQRGAASMQLVAPRDRLGKGCHASPLPSRVACDSSPHCR
jgi:hypothetical protein